MWNCFTNIRLGVMMIFCFLGVRRDWDRACGYRPRPAIAALHGCASGRAWRPCEPDRERRGLPADRPRPAKRAVSSSASVPESASGRRACVLICTSPLRFVEHARRICAGGVANIVRIGVRSTSPRWVGGSVCVGMRSQPLVCLDVSTLVVGARHHALVPGL
jgi:hypothetical protein